MLDEIIGEEEKIADEREATAAQLGTAILQRPIRELLTLRKPVCVAPEANVREAACRMKEGGAGCVLVEAEGKLIGIFTERDVLTRIVAAGRDAEATLVGEVMTADPEVLRPDDRVSYALNVMGNGGFRHVPLVDGEDRPVGVVSMRNVVDYTVELFRTELLHLPPSPRHMFRGRDGA